MLRIPAAHVANACGATIFAVDTLHYAAAYHLPNVATAGTALLALHCSLDTGCSDGDTYAHKISNCQRRRIPDSWVGRCVTQG